MEDVEEIPACIQEAFRAYEKMSLNTESWKAEDMTQCEKAKWVVTEKIHGANITIYTDGTTVKFARRGGFIQSHETFFGLKLLAPTLKKHALLVYNLIQQQPTTLYTDTGPSEPVALNVPPTATSGSETDATASAVVAAGPIVVVSIHAELFGGGYPQFKQEPKPSDDYKSLKYTLKSTAPFVPVQHGVFYAEDLHACVFDMAVYRTPEMKRTYISYEVMKKVGEAAGMMCAQPLLIGSYREAMNYAIGFDSTIPNLLGSRKLPAGFNKAEGVVIKTVDPLYIRSKKSMVRAIVKHKIGDFTERTKNYTLTKTPNQSELVNVMAAFGSFINVERVHSAESKYDLLSADTVAPITQLLVDDVKDAFLEEAAIEDITEYSKLSKVDMETVMSFVERKCHQVVQQALVEMMNQNCSSSSNVDEKNESNKQAAQS